MVKDLNMAKFKQASVEDGRLPRELDKMYLV